MSEAGLEGFLGVRQGQVGRPLGIAVASCCIGISHEFFEVSLDVVVDSDECVPRLLALNISDFVWVLGTDAGHMVIDGFAEPVDDSLADISREGRDYAVAVVEHSLWEFFSRS